MPNKPKIMRAQPGSSQTLMFTAHLASILTGKCYPHTPLPNSSTALAWHSCPLSYKLEPPALPGSLEPLAITRKLVKRQGFVYECV